MPNLLNNLLRNIRQKERPNESIDSVAKSMNIDYISGTYLTKIENGDLKKPKDIEPIARAYSDGGIDWLPLLKMVDAYVRNDNANDDPSWTWLKNAYRLFLGSPFSCWVFGTLYDLPFDDSHRGALLRKFRHDEIDMKNTLNAIDNLSAQGTALISADYARRVAHVIDAKTEQDREKVIGHYTAPPFRCIKPSVAHTLTFGTPCAVSFHGVILLINAFHNPVMTASTEVLAKWQKNFNVAMASPLNHRYFDNTLFGEEVKNISPLKDVL
jgi:hypothetical protein